MIGQTLSLSDLVEERFFPQTKNYFQSNTINNKLFNWNLKEDWLFNYKDDSSSITANPLFNFQFNSPTGYTNSRGGLLQGSYNKVRFGVILIENQVKVPSTFTLDRRYNFSFPGIGPSKYSNNEFDFAESRGYLEVDFDRVVFGVSTDKFKVGKGIRSLFLSDHVPGYANMYFKVNLGPVEIGNINAIMLNPFYNHASTGEPFQKKGMALKYLNLNIKEKLNIKLIEMVTYQMNDSISNRGFEWYYLNPVLVYRPVEFSLGSPDNMNVGMEISFEEENWMVYSQLLIDDLNIAKSKMFSGFQQNKLAFKIGGFCSLINDRVTFAYEFVSIDPYTYSHRNPSQNHSHLNSSLAHPFGANLFENILMTDIQLTKSLTIRFYSSFIRQGMDADNWGEESFGGNIFKSEESAIYGIGSYHNYIAQGDRIDVFRLGGRLQYFFKKNQNASLFISSDNQISQRYSYSMISIGLSNLILTPNFLY